MANLVVLAIFGYDKYFIVLSYQDLLDYCAVGKSKTNIISLIINYIINPA